MTSVPPEEPKPGAPAETGVQIGVDHWGAPADERRQERTGLTGRVVHLWRLLPPAGKLALLTPAIAVPFLPISQGNLFNYGIFILIYALLALGLNIVVGYAGLLDLGYVAFFGFGAYATALLTGATLNTTTGSAAPAFSMHLNFYVAIPIIVLLAAGVGVLIGAPVLRLRGDYLAIVTLGLGETVSILISSNWLKPLVGGPQGMRNITDAQIA